MLQQFINNIVFWHVCQIKLDEHKYILLLKQKDNIHLRIALHNAIWSLHF